MSHRVRMSEIDTGCYYRSGPGVSPEGHKSPASTSQHDTAEASSKPQIPFFTVSNTSSTSRGFAKASAASLADNQPQGSSQRLPPTAPDPTAEQADPPARPQPSSRPQSSSSQHQLQDLGFEDVDLDSPDANISKTRSDQAQPPSRSLIMPIPFMQQRPHYRPQASPAKPRDLQAADSASATLPGMPSLYAFSPSAHSPTSPSGLSTQSDAHVTTSHGQSRHVRGLFKPADSHTAAAAAGNGESSASTGAGLYQDVPSAPAAGPFSTYSGPPSTSSSTPASPGAPLAEAGAPPARRSSFLPRGMSSHLQKALKATAAAASKASAAIAPPPSSINTSSSQHSWQEQAAAQQPALSLPTAKGDQDQEVPFQPPWGPSGPASTGSQERKEHGKPWWQQQLCNLQQNLQNPQQLQSDAASDSDTSSVPGSSTAKPSKLNPYYHHQHQRAASKNGNVDFHDDPSELTDLPRDTSETHGHHQGRPQTDNAGRLAEMDDYIQGGYLADEYQHNQQQGQQQMPSDSMQIWTDKDRVDQPEAQHVSIAGLADAIDAHLEVSLLTD